MDTINSATVMYGSRHRTTRKRKPDEIDKELSDALSSIEADTLGPFWFQRSKPLLVKGRMVHVGLLQRERLELEELVRTNYITEEFLKEILVPLNDESSSVPRLRMYNWAVTNYAKGKGISTKVIDADGNEKFIDPSISYNSTLKKLHRPLFDPYRRGTLLFFKISATAEATSAVAESSNDLSLVHHTTVGQLLFVKWCIDNGVDKYVQNHEAEIRDHLNTTARERATKGKRRVKELTETKCKHARIIPNLKRQKTTE